MRQAADRVMSGFARLLVRIFFREIEVEQGENLPENGPVVVVANHINGLVDGLLLMATLPRFPRFLGKSTLFRIPPLWPFLKLAGVVPVYRAMDGAPGDHNVSAFATSHGILAAGGVVALFPEGISHDESSLQPLKTGAARIALEAGLDGGGERVVTVAVGLTYDAKARFRSRALVRIGPSADVGRWSDAYRHDSHEAVRQFTIDVAERLTAVSPAYASWEQAEQVSRVAEVVVRLPEQTRAADVALGDQVGVAERLARMEQQVPGDPALRGLLAAFAVYERDLTLLGLDDAQVASTYVGGRLRGPLAWAILKVLAAIPFAAVGVIVHVVPFQIMKWLAKKPSNESIKATVKLLGCFASFTVVYAALGYVFGRAFGAGAGLLASLGAPLCGYVAVRLAERAKRIGGVLEGYRTVKGRRAVVESVLAHRALVVDAARAVLTP